jgi:hypothetical protein
MIVKTVCESAYEVLAIAEKICDISGRPENDFGEEEWWTVLPKDGIRAYAV